jgi:hypothetical protein
MEAKIRTRSRKALEELRLARQQADVEAFQPIYVQALWGFAAREPKELEFRQGEIITVTEPIVGDWWKGKLGDRTGIFPSNYVEEIPKDRVEVVWKQREEEEQQRRRREFMDWMLREQRETWLRKLNEEGVSPSVENVKVPEQGVAVGKEAATAQLEAMAFQKSDIDRALSAENGDVKRALEYLLNVSLHRHKVCAIVITMFSIPHLPLHMSWEALSHRRVPQMTQRVLTAAKRSGGIGSDPAPALPLRPG